MSQSEHTGVRPLTDINCIIGVFTDIGIDR
jgi:hypothetical protein